MQRDEQIFDLILEEQDRQIHGLELIASENFVSDQVMEAAGSVLTPITVIVEGESATTPGGVSPEPARPAATRSMPQMVHFAPRFSDVIHGCIGHW